MSNALIYRYDGISASSFVDYLALMGDTADGIPVSDSVNAWLRRVAQPDSPESI